MIVYNSSSAKPQTLKSASTLWSQAELGHLVPMVMEKPNSNRNRHRSPLDDDDDDNDDQHGSLLPGQVHDFYSRLVMVTAQARQCARTHTHTHTHIHTCAHTHTPPHTYSPSQAKPERRRQLPMVKLIRESLDACLSVMMAASPQLKGDFAAKPLRMFFSLWPLPTAVATASEIMLSSSNSAVRLVSCSETKLVSFPTHTKAAPKV